MSPPHPTVVPKDATNGTSLTVDPDDVQRDSVEVERDDGETEEVRFYYAPDIPSLPLMPSVTSITNFREDAEKKGAIEGWRQKYDGSSSYARPWWKDQMAFKSARGTLGHYAVLSQLGDPLTEQQKAEGDGEYGPEEVEAIETLKNWSEEAPSASADDQRTPRNNSYDGEHAWDRAMRDISWVCSEFDDVWSEQRGLSTEDVIDVERYVVDTEYGYAGQLDLLYEWEGDTILCDLKLSSGIRIDYKIQLAAYARAIEEDVDRLEVQRYYPDKSVVEIETDEDWARTRRGLEHEFLGLVDQTQNVHLSNALAETDQASLLNDD